VKGFELGGRDVAELPVEPSLVEPVLPQQPNRLDR
jgi:hypothetical protein